jgi:hypothetical protein
MSDSEENKNLVKRLVYDMAIYAGTKFVLHKATPHSVPMVSLADLVEYLISDYLYDQFIDSYFEDIQYLDKYTSFNHKVERFFALSFETSIIKYVAESHHGILGNIAAIGISEGVQLIIDQIRGEKKN